MTTLDDPRHDREAGNRASTLDTTRIDDVRIGAVRPLITPALLQQQVSVDHHTLALVESSQKAIGSVLHGTDRRLVVVVGPCSIHDYDQAIEYATRLKTAARSRRKLFWKFLAGTSSAVITIAVLAVVRSEPAPSVTQTSGPSVSPPPAVASPACERLDCTPTVSNQSTSSPAAPVVVEHLTPRVASIPPVLPETAQPESRAASPATTQAEKELADSQPDG